MYNHPPFLQACMHTTRNTLLDNSPRVSSFDENETLWRLLDKQIGVQRGAHMVRTLHELLGGVNLVYPCFASKLCTPSYPPINRCSAVPASFTLALTPRKPNAISACALQTYMFSAPDLVVRWWFPIVLHPKGFILFCWCLGPSCSHLTRRCHPRGIPRLAGVVKLLWLGTKLNSLKWCLGDYCEVISLKTHRGLNLKGLALNPPGNSSWYHD